MTNWIEYKGTKEQLDEIVNCKTDVLCRYKNGTERLKSTMFIGDWKHAYLTHYLICNPHPLAEMIIRHAQTGQPVWVREFTINGRFVIVETTTPDWNIPNAEYSFKPFGGELDAMAANIPKNPLPVEY